MPPECKVKVLTGPPGSGKTRFIIHETLPFLKQNRSSEVLILVPSNLRADEIQQALLAQKDLSGVLGLNILTFLDLTLSVFRDSTLPGRIQTPLVRKWMIQSILSNLSLQILKEVKETLGFVSLTTGLIRMLKEGGITAEEFRTLSRGAESAPKLRELSKVYEEYEKRRRERNLVDREDLFELAIQQLERNPEGPFSTLRRITVTGFYDFTPLQLKLLASLSGLPNLEALTLTLVQAPGTGPAQRFTQRTLQRVLNIFPRAETLSAHSEEARAIPPLLHLSRHFFTPMDKVQPVPARDAIRILQAPGSYREVEEMARNIRRLMDEEGFHFKDFAVVFRNMNQYQETVREVFGFFGIAYHMTSGLPLGSNPLIQTITGLLEIPRSRYRRNRVIRLLRSDYIRFQPLAQSSITPERIDILSRDAMIHGGREEWQRRFTSRIKNLEMRMERLQESPLAGDDVERAEERVREVGRHLEELTECRKIIEELFATLDTLPLRAPLARFVEVLSELLGTFQVEKQIYTVDNFRVIRRDQIALREFRSVVGQMVQDHEAVGTEKTFSLEEFSRLVDHTLFEAEYTPESPGEDALLITDALGIRGLKRPVVFMGGLIEEEFPRTHHADPIMGESDRIHINRYLGPERWIPLTAHWRQEEDLLFYLAASSATRILCLTYPRTDARARDHLPSRYIERVNHLFEEKSLKKTSIPLKDPLPGPQETFRNKELVEIVLRGLHRPISREPVAPTLFNYLLKNKGRQIEQILEGLCVIRARNRSEASYMGSLGEDAARRLRQDERAFSVTALEIYGQCPFRYLFEKEIKVQPVEEVEDEMGARDMGSLYHKILELFFRQIGGPVTTGNIENLRNQLHPIIEQVLSRAESKGIPGHEKIWEIRKEEVHQILNGLLEAEAEDHEKYGEKPAHFEASFGLPCPAQSDPLSTDKPLRLESETGPIHLKGKVDRIDISNDQEGDSFSVLDYKSGRSAASTKQIQEGGSLQLPVYADWVGQAFSNRRQMRRGCFYLLRAGKRHCQIGGKGPSWEELREVTRGHVRKYVESIRKAEFPVTKNKCTEFCSLTSICRIREA